MGDPNITTTAKGCSVSFLFMLRIRLHLWPCCEWYRFAQDLVQSPARAAVTPNCRNVSAQIQGIAESHHDGASCRAADSVEVMPNGFDCSVALNGVRQMQRLGHGTTLEAKPSYGSWIGLDCDI